MNSTGPSGDTTRDDFLGGALKVHQPKEGYRAGVDPVLLAASVDARPGQTVLDLGCGVGVAGLCLAHRVGGVTICGVEVQPDYVALARQNGRDNGIDMAVVLADIADLPAKVRAQRFDHVIANPPYFDRANGTAADNAGRDLGRAGTTTLDVWVQVAARRVAPRGSVTFINRAERLPDLLAAMAGRLGSIVVQPIAARQNRTSGMVIVRSRKEGKAAFRLLAPLVLHRGERHTRDEDSYTAQVAGILRQGAALSLD